MALKALYNKYFIAIFCILAVASFALIGSIDNSEQDLEKSDIRIHEMDSDESLYKVVSTIGSSPTLLVLYTSWCSNCVEKMPKIVKIISKYKDVNPVIISLDTNRSKLISFLLDLSTVNFTPYRISPEYHGKLAYALTGKGVYFNGKIPFVAVLGGRNPPVTGITSTGALLTAIESALME
ncbi:TlpA family protein disulfide reductase [Anaplasma bovis]|uniref:TlpA family protein disulfide reductase n=1 Tax=Anaplasma bovis TaxID=186733 RepID=UPI002FEEBB3C